MNKEKNVMKCKIDIRCTREEKDYIIRTAQEKEMSTADYVRSKVFKKERQKVLRAKDKRIVEKAVGLTTSVNKFESYLYRTLPEELIDQSGILYELDKLKEEVSDIWDNCLL